MLAITGVVLVPDQQVDGQALEPPVRVRLYQLPYQLDVGRIGDLQQHDRQVAGNGLAPQAGLATPVAQQHAGLGAQRGRYIEDRPGQALVQLRVRLRGIELAQQHLAMRPRQVEDAVCERAIAVFLDQCQATRPPLANPGDDVHRRRLLGLQGNPASNRHHRVQHGAFRVGEAVHCHRRRARQCPASAQEARTVGFVGDLIHFRIVHRHQVAHPRHRLVLGSRPSRADDGLQRLDQLGLHEQLAEGRMQRIGNGRGKHHFGVTGQFDGAADARAVPDGGTAQLDVVLGGNDDFRMDVEVLLAAAEFRARVGEDGLVAGRLAERGLVRGGPEFSGGDVPEVAEAASGVAGPVFLPAGHGHVAEAAVAAACAADHHMIAAVGQQLHRRAAGIGIGEYPQLGLGDTR